MGFAFSSTHPKEWHVLMGEVCVYHAYDPGARTTPMTGPIPGLLAGAAQSRIDGFRLELNPSYGMALSHACGLVYHAYDPEPAPFQ
jgi:hypothetical protein